MGKKAFEDELQHQGAFPSFICCPSFKVANPLRLYILQSNEGLSFTPVRRAEAAGSGAEGMWGNCSSISLGWTREIRLRAGSDGNRAGLNVCFLTATEQGRLDVGDTITFRLCSPLLRPQNTNSHTRTYIYIHKEQEQFLWLFWPFFRLSTWESFWFLPFFDSFGLPGHGWWSGYHSKKKKKCMHARTHMHSLSLKHTLRQTHPLSIHIHTL